MDLDLLLVAARLAVGLWLLWRIPVLTASPRSAGADRPDRPALAVVVPARNEEANLARHLPALLAATWEGDEVVVVDDGSADATTAVADRLGARVVAAGPVPDGWAGKPWAAATGAAATGAGRLVFVDADVHVEPGGLDAVAAALDRHGGLVSVQPHHRPGSAAEQLAGLFNVVAVMATDAASPLGLARGSRGAFGPVLACARSDYEAAGGHAAVAGSVVEDVALAERFRAAGRAVTIRLGGDRIWFRMYPGGLHDLFEGFAKNLVAGARAVRPFTVALVVAWLTLLVQGAWWLARTPVTGGWRGPVLYAVVVAQLAWMLGRVGRFRWWVAPAFPVLVGVFGLVFVRSVVAAARGRVSWKGRSVPTRRRRGGRGSSGARPPTP